MCKKNFLFSFYRKKVRLLIELFRLFENFNLKRLFLCNRVLELSKDNQKQHRAPTFCVGPGAKRVFGLACIEKSSSLSSGFSLI